MKGASTARPASIERAIASAWPRSSALTPGIGPRRIAERQNRQPEAAGQFEQAHRLAIAFRHRHAEIVLKPRLGVVALLLAEKCNRASTEPRQARHNCLILTEGTVAGQRCQVVENHFGIVEKMRASG